MFDAFMVLHNFSFVLMSVFILFLCIGLVQCSNLNLNQNNLNLVKSLEKGKPFS
jgi:hypothetical protein